MVAHIAESRLTRSRTITRWSVCLLTSASLLASCGQRDDGVRNPASGGRSGNGAGGASGANGNGFGSQGSHGSSTGGFNAAAVAAPAIAAVAEAEADGPVCMMRPGDAGFDECEACQ